MSDLSINGVDQKGFDWDAWLKKNMPDWNSSDTASFYQELSSTLHSVIEASNKAQKKNTQELRQIIEDK